MENCAAGAIQRTVASQMADRSTVSVAVAAEYMNLTVATRFGLLLERSFQGLREGELKRGMASKRTIAVDSSTESRSRVSFIRDDRAIEGLPIRLVIALVVGVAALALMLNMLGGIGDVGDTEVTVRIDDGELIEADQGGVDGEVVVSSSTRAGITSKTRPSLQRRAPLS